MKECITIIENHLMNFDVSYLGGVFLLYLAITYVVKYVGFTVIVGNSIYYNLYCAKQYSLFSFLSVDYLLSSMFKDRLSFYQLDNHIQAKSSLIVYFNRSNLILSLIFLLASVVSIVYDFYIHYFVCFCALRFISRFIEISLAFARDVVTEPGDINIEGGQLDKYRRIRLALKSYIEVFVISASLYSFTFKAESVGLLKSLNLSFGVGTFTNTSALLDRVNSPYMEALMYFQIFTTLILVVMSFAIYIGREK